MADDKNPKLGQDIGKVNARDITDEMSQSYLDYAMSVIVARALPDVRDGLKPVHRRILHAMNELNLRSRSKYTKSAKIVGEVMGKYHPHGDQAIYSTLARMVQDFAMRYPLIDGQGNFGSMDGDNPAAMRYTEARMAAVAEELLADIDKNTVDFIDNYDGSQQEPTYLPAKLPNLLLNGALGIAVGMATNIPPHNLKELVAGSKQLIDNPDLGLEELVKIVPGPDFPTGGTIYGREDIVNAYATGKGSIVMRADAKIVETKVGGFRILISAIPYQVNKAELVAKIANLVKERKIEGISDIRDESDRNEMVRIVIELKSKAYPKKVLNQLYNLTPLQNTFNLNMIALQGGLQPRIYTLKEALLAFVEHRILVVTRRTNFELKRAQDRAHILEGLKKALDKIDQIIATIRASKTRAEAAVTLVKKFSLTKIQAEAILEMKLSTLAGLERQRIFDELEEKLKLISDLQAILASDQKIKQIVKDELEEVSTKYGDERRTKIIAARVGDFSAEDLIPNETVVITLTKGNYIKRVLEGTYKAQRRGGKGIVGMTTKEEDEVNILRVAQTHDDILFFTSKGRLFKSKVYELPSASRQAKGIPLVNIIQLASDEIVTALITINPKTVKDNSYFFMGTQNGVVKKTLIKAYENVRKTGIAAIKLRPEDELKWVWITSGSDEILMVSQKGQSIRFDEEDARPMGRSASGVRGMKLRSGDSVISLDIINDPEQEFLLTVSEKGFGKRTKVALFTKQNRGGIGLRAAKVTAKTGMLSAAEVVSGNLGEVVMVSKHGQTIRLALKAIKSLGRDTQGVTLMRFKNKSDYVASLTVFIKQLEEQKTSPSKY